jgi:hypothetical protein
MPSTNGHGPKRAILYARVSTDEQTRSGYSPTQQIEALRDYAARGGTRPRAERRQPGEARHGPCTGPRCRGERIHRAGAG